MSIEQARSKYLKILGVLLVAAALYGFLEYHQSAELALIHNWPKTSGEITSSEVGLRSSSTNKVVSYEHKIQYRYNVGGQNYYGTKHGLHDQVSSIYREDIESKVIALPVGTKVTVYYELGNEGNSVLVR
jgi:hypothetical protein